MVHSKMSVTRFVGGTLQVALVENNCCDSELKKDNMSVINKGSFKRINGHRSEKWLLWADNSIKYVKQEKNTYLILWEKMF